MAFGTTNGYASETESMDAFINIHRQLIDEHLEATRGLLADEQIKGLGAEYNDSNNSRPEKALNVFEMVSDLYYRENFHSDIIKVFLDPKEKHNEGATFLFAFIDFINANFSKRVCISKQNYISASVQRELGKIDILIESEDSRHCIIIENKMANAGDMYRQLPRYYDYMKGLGYDIDAIIYLPLDINKQPDQSTWTTEDKQNVLPLLCVVPAYQKNNKNLVNGWIEPCIHRTNNPDCGLILRQYGELLKTLTNNNMDNIILSKFYQSLMEGKSLETALSIRNMLQELPVFMADRLCARFKIGQGDYRVWKYKPNFCGILFEIDRISYKIDIWTSENGYSVYVFGQDQNSRIMDWAEGMASLESFILANEEYRKTDFTFYDEEEVIHCVNAIIEEMRKRLVK